MKSILIIIVALTCFSAVSFSQTSYTIPAGFTIFKNFEDSTYRIKTDFDNDGIDDLVTVYAKSNSQEDNIIAIYLSSHYNINKTTYSFTFNSYSYNIGVKNNVLTIGSCFGNGRYCKTLKFKYYPLIKNMRLIGYDEESFGNAVHEGAYYKSVNLLTNKYEINGPKWKTKVVKQSQIPIMTLDKFDEKSLDYLESIGAAIINN